MRHQLAPVTIDSALPSNYVHACTIFVAAVIEGVVEIFLLFKVENVEILRSFVLV